MWMKPNILNILKLADGAGILELQWLGVEESNLCVLHHKMQALEFELKRNL